MTAEEVNAKFQAVKLQFDSYYKYTFYFKGSLDGFTLEVSKGGNSDDIYRLRVERDAPETFYEVANWYEVSVKDDAGQEVFQHSDW